MVKNSGGNLIAAVTVVLIVMALLAMSIPRQRIPQRTNQCATNMKNLALASVQHDFSKTYLPGYIQDFGIYAGNGSDPTDPTNRGIPHHKKLGTWAVAILPWLEGQATYEHWAQDRYPIIVADPKNPPHLGSTTGSAGEGFHMLASPNLGIFQCASNPANDSQNAPNSMIYNNGMAWPTNHTSFANAPNVNNGVGNSKYNVTMVDRTTGEGTHTAEGPNTTLGDFKDGQSYTILFSENIQALPWHRAGLIHGADLIMKDQNQQDIVFDSKMPKALAARYIHGMVWHYEDAEHANAKLANQWNKLGTATPVRPSGVAPVHRINGCMNGNKDSLFNLRIRDAESAVHLARPSSAHPNGVNTAFADGATRFVDENIDYRVFQALMTPNGKASSVPFTKFVLPAKFRN
tara:strand:+ start:144 stop:1355 length:1212 start_codon:yes stop_codon:yes gene_type:complete